MSLFVFFTLVIIGSATNIVAPFAEFEHVETQKKILGLDCKKLSDQDVYRKTEQKFGKKSNFNKSEISECKNPIFHYGERSSFYQFLTENYEPQVRTLVDRVVATAQQTHKTANKFHIQIVSPDPRVKSFLYPVFQTELHNRGQIVIRQLGHSENTLKIRVNETSVADFLFTKSQLRLRNLAHKQQQKAEWIVL